MANEPVVAYADGVRALFARAASKDRGTGQPAPVETLVPQGEQLASLSEFLNVELASNLEAANPEDRITAATRLLAKSLTDLEVSAYLGRAAEQEGAGLATDRAVPATPNVAGYLALLTEESGPGERPDRARDTTAGDLTTMVGDDLSIISSRAAEAAKTAFQKLAAIGLGQVAQAAGSIGLNVANFFGAGEALTRIYQLCRQFAVNAYNALVALVGDKLVEFAGEKVTGWMKEYLSADSFSGWLTRQYDVDATAKALEAELTEKPPQLPEACVRKLEWLVEQHRKQMELLSKLIKGMDYLRLVPGAATPQGAALFATSYVLICGYAVFSGADYLDAPRLDVFKRVQGVPSVVRGAF
jgi:hypothetical protein